MTRALLATAALTLVTLALGEEPNPPQWPDSVSVFTPDTDPAEIQKAVEAAFASNGNDPADSSVCNNGQFSDERFAFMFAPGTYSTDVPVGFYTSVYGLGEAPTDTNFVGEKGVFAENGCGWFQVGALDTFWRSAENFHSSATFAWAVGTGMTWAVSQAAPLRNVKVDNDLLFFEYVTGDAAGYASGGWASGVDVGGAVSFGSQQQFSVRSSSASAFDKPVWNGVFAGVDGAPEAQCGSEGNPSISVESEVPLIAEKPFITYDEGGEFNLVVPGVESGASGVAQPMNNATTVPFENVYVTDPSDTAAIINGKLSEGLHVVVSPGIYELEDSIKVKQEGQVVLGLGFATLIAPSNGEPCLKVGDVGGVRVAGLLLEAGAWETRGGMLQVGETGKFEGSAANPVVLSDVFARVGGQNTGVGPVDTMFNIQSGFTIVDNTWLWRADHTDGNGGDDVLVKNSDNAVKNGIVVNADDVFAYGLAAEHTTEDNVVWNGDRGTTFFYQAEIMYDYLEDKWPFSCYKIGEGVIDHKATGLGCYSYFRDYAGSCESGVDTGGGSFDIDKAVSVWLNGMDGSSIKNVIDNDGMVADGESPQQFYCSEKKSN